MSASRTAKTPASDTESLHSHIGPDSVQKQVDDLLAKEWGILLPPQTGPISDFGTLLNITDGVTTTEYQQLDGAVNIILITQVDVDEEARIFDLSRDPKPTCFDRAPQIDKLAVRGEPAFKLKIKESVPSSQAENIPVQLWNDVFWSIACGQCDELPSVRCLGESFDDTRGCRSLTRLGISSPEAIVQRQHSSSQILGMDYDDVLAQLAGKERWLWANTPEYTCVGVGYLEGWTREQVRSPLVRAMNRS